VAQRIPGVLPGKWRSRAQFLRDFGGTPEAVKLWETAAAEFEEWFEEFQGEALTLAQAAEESGLTIDYVGALVRQGKLANAGKKNAPRIRRADLPTKGARSRGAKSQAAPTGPDNKDLTAIAEKLRG
jgi:hypothetical protein